MPFLFQIQFTSLSVLWIFASLLIGFGYAFLLYRNNSSLAPALRKSLFAIRAISVASICFLLFAPLVRTADKSVEKPLIFILLDNSASLINSKPSGFSINDYNNSIKKLIDDFGEDYEVKTISFGDSVKDFSSPTYKEKSTNIGSAFKYINDHFSNRNIGAVILASDGIYNRGNNPLYESQNLKAPIYTVALGDTVPKKDILIANVNYNDLVLQGNEFQIEINLNAFQSKGSTSKLSISNNSAVLFSRDISFPVNEFRTTLPVILPARQKGIQKFTVNLSPVTGELSKENNTYTFFVEVIDGKKKVYILANSPHPDIAAIKQSIESNKNYEVKTGIASNFSKEDLEKANLVILHQLPADNLQWNSVKPFITRKSVWFIVGEQTNTNILSANQKLLNIVSNGSDQESFARINSAFYDFTLSPATQNKIQNLAPLVTPFGNYAIKEQSAVLLNQQIGKLSTEKPLLIFSTDGDHKTAILTGEGIWRWRLEDFKENESHEAVNELITKTVQFLSSKDDKKKFKVYPSKNTFDESEHILLNGELYNNSYELVNTPDVKVTIRSTKGKTYSYILSRTGKTYILDAGILPSGEYSFHATTLLGENKLASEGRFIITTQLDELRQTTANHQILSNISNQSNGKLIFPNEIWRLAEQVKKNELVKAISYENRRYEDLINQKALFAIILLLLGAEWLGRKRNGEI